MSIITIDVICRDLTDECEISDHIDSIDYLCEEEKEELFDDICYDGLPIITEMRQGAFVDCLEEYFVERHPEYQELEDAVRAFSRDGAVDTRQGTVTVCHGIGYAWRDKDLLGGSGDGRTFDDFAEFCEKRHGINFHFVYQEEV